MRDTVKALVESSARPEFDFITENTNTFNNILSEITEAEKSATRFTAQKVIVTKIAEAAEDGTNEYVVEYSHNLERLMKENDIGITEAMDIIADINNIPVEECTVVFDEASIESMDFTKLNEIEKKYKVVRA